MLPEKVKQLLEKQGYRIVGRHSAVKICHWTKESLSRNRVCYKELWYPPVQSHRCMEMTPYIGCNYHCVFCWRTHSNDRPGLSWKEFPLEIEEFDKPDFIIEEAIKKRAELLSGFGGNPNTDKKKFLEALKPKMMTMSLIGEPTLYPFISDLVLEAKKRDMITFIVTNGSMPERLQEMKHLPFQLYLSVLAPNKETYLKIARPMIKGAWERFNKTVEIFRELKNRRVFRLTMVKKLNMFDAKKYVEFIKKGEPDFVEVKAYEWVGESRRRLKSENVPKMEDIENFAKKISELSGYKIFGRFEPSRVVMLTRE